MRACNLACRRRLKSLGDDLLDQQRDLAALRGRLERQAAEDAAEKEEEIAVAKVCAWKACGQRRVEYVCVCA